MANENNYFEFLDIPDGSGGTERWYAKDAEARAAIAQLDPASVIEVADVTQLTSAQVEGLVVGGAVNKSDSTGKHSYRVTYKSATGCCLTYYDAENIETVAYEKSEDTWAYLDTTITAIADKADKSQLSGKADKVGSGHNNELAGLNSTGNLKATNLAIADVQNTVDDMDDVLDAIGYTAEFVDLGLPSGTLWAKMNIGANSETEYGNYYMYGKGDRQYNSEDSDYEGTENPLASDKDTATVMLGAPWRMPTQAQMQELIDNTTYTWEEDFNGSGINGGKLTAQNGNYIFLPAAGDWFSGSQRFVGDSGAYWGSTPNGSDSAFGFRFGSSGTVMNDYYRNSGYSVRPVCDSAPLVKMSSKADKKDTYTKTEVNTLLNGKANTSHNHDERYYQKSQVYTKAETQQYVNQRVGLEYDAENRCVTFPASSVANYDRTSRSINFPALTI